MTEGADIPIDIRDYDEGKLRMTFESLTGIYQKETSMDGLSPITPSFYDDCAELASHIRAERQACTSYHEQDRLADLLKNIHIQTEGVWEKRLGKIVSSLCMGQPENMLPDELEAFEGMSSVLAGLQHETMGRLEQGYRGGK